MNQKNKNKLTLPKGTKLPDHVALILDGNRRWARVRGLKPWEGHRAGYQAVLKLAKASRDLGIHTFTIWAFSTENWNRPKKEIDEVMKLLDDGLREIGREIHKEKVRLIHLGRKDRFPSRVTKTIAKLEESTSMYQNNVLNLALDYGGRDEILRTVKKIIDQGISVDKIDENLFASFLDTGNQPHPYPDLFIRTSGEQRTSGLLPWQMTYSEYYFEQSHLPDFTPAKFKQAILDYSHRRRRFGANDTVKHLTFKPELMAKIELAWWRLANIPEGVRFLDYAADHLKEQLGLSKKLAKEAAHYLLEALSERNNGKNWKKAKAKVGKFCRLVKDELGLALEPKIVAFFSIKLMQETENKKNKKNLENTEEETRELFADTYNISNFQAIKLAQLRILADRERGMAESGMGEEHWALAGDYLEKFYYALKDKIA